MKRWKWVDKVVFAVLIVAFAGAAIASVTIGNRKYYPQEGDEKMQILFLGDSNMAFDFGQKAIPDQLAEKMDVTVYNCAIGGTTATKINHANYFDHYFDPFCLYNFSKVLLTGNYQTVRDNSGDKSGSNLTSLSKIELGAKIDLDKIDYIVIGYGLNDYTTGQTIGNDNPYDEETYCGAMRSSIERLQKANPNVKIILCSISYCWFWEENKTFIDGYSKDWGGGTIDQFRDALCKVSQEYENVYFIDNLEALEIDATNYSIFLRDDMHLSPAGQVRYVNNLKEVIEQIERENN